MSFPRRKTFCVAIIGADGSGKTSVARAILESESLRFRYVYMGRSLSSANYALPTTRLLNRLKKDSVRGPVPGDGSLSPGELMSGEMRRRLPVRGRVVKALGLINRIAEEWYRQLVIQVFRVRGFSVLCDRHFLFEYCPDSAVNYHADDRLSVRIHRWMLSKCYPQPHLVIHLFARPEVLHARKPEWTVDHLAKSQMAMRDQGRKARCYLEVDAARPLEVVIADVNRLIGQLHGGRLRIGKNVTA
jgi:thymidylate kinase